ncbi:MAG: SDR family NAD(P)-dependent oxidoreductase [Phenylobacterium sp.]|uniref:SDR family NAD(P)-dependent oxidoreductase n=1 Tax=Phenylobacterium sp. TaxID=1871053 RepID=UPI0027324B35|nr:SDR family NAD(P)-dependent oxidoreductase [Phenylobacterium sp.]MDP3173824.1 SDR family NAD(P)-dependent oxidoreductase [Phenylobacterium sp.]
MSKSLLVTGGFGVLGRAVSAAAVARGWRTALVDFSPEPPAGLAASLGDGAYLKGGVDLADPAAARAVVEDVAQRQGGLDVLVNVAGGFTWTTLADGGVEPWGELHRLNLTTALNASAAAIPLLTQSTAGRIINVGANAAVKAAAGMGPYAASKAAIHRLTETLSEELKDQGVTVNAVLPSILDTPTNRADMPDADFTRWVTPDALAQVILFLASDEASAVTGALLPVTGRV